MTTKGDASLVHPGKILGGELDEIGLSPADFDDALAVPPGTTAALVDARCSITPELALRLARYFGTTGKFWMNLQNAYDLKIAERKHGDTVAAQITPRPTDPIPTASEPALAPAK